MDKEIVGLIAVFIGFIGYIPYFVGIFKNQVKPHIFSWLVFGIMMAVTYAGQASLETGPGAWVTLATAATAFVIAGLALFKGEKHITRSDWISLALALSTLPLWMVTQTPLYSIILIILIDCFAFFPTVRKSWNKPNEESLLTYISAFLKYGVAFFAMTNFDPIALAYPAFLTLFNFGFIALLMWRRHNLYKKIAWN
jgi:hypothetical protein